MISHPRGPDKIIAFAFSTGLLVLGGETFTPGQEEQISEKLDGLLQDAMSSI